MAGENELRRVAFSPGEFAALFGKSQTWGYRQIYAGKVKTITEYGRIQIPAAEVERILATAGLYDGLKEKPATTKEEIKKLVARTSDPWRKFIAARQQSNRPSRKSRVAARKSDATSSDLRKAALERLKRKS